MIQVKPGQKIPLVATIPDRTSGLVVKATIEKLDGTILTTVTLTEIHPGDHADQSFPMPTGVDFLKAKFRVFESDGITPSVTNGDFDELYEVIVPLFRTELKVVVGCEEQPRQNPVDVVQTSDKNILISFVDEDGNALDTSSATAVAFRMRKADSTTLSKTLLSGISPVAGQFGQYLVQMLAADFALLPLGSLDVQVELDMGGLNEVLQLRQAVFLDTNILT